MEERSARFLVSTEGRSLARDLDTMEGGWDRRLRRLRKTLPSWQAAALVDQARGRMSLMRRHPSGDRLFVTARGAAQSSSALAASWRARRFQGLGPIADLGAGLGIDALALSENGPVVAVERDPGLAILLRENLSRTPNPALTIRAHIEEGVPETDWAFCDPDRRPGGRRISDPEEGSPPLSLLSRFFNEGRWEGLAVKLAPAVPTDLVGDLGELEFVSIGRELKEVVLWMGDLARGRRRVALPDRGFEWEGPRDTVLPVTAPGAFVHRPDPALARSGLAGGLAAELGVLPLDDDQRLYTSDEALGHPAFKSMPILAVTTASRRRVQALVNDSALGPLTATRCGRGPSPEQFLKGLRSKGRTPAHFFLTTLGGRPHVVVAHPHAESGRDEPKTGAI